MSLPRRRVHDDELPELPPLEDDEPIAGIDLDVEILSDEAPLPSDDLPHDAFVPTELDEPVALGDDDDDPVAVGTFGEDDDGMSDGHESWRSEPDEGHGEPDDVDPLDALPPDDGGAEGMEIDRDDDLDDLPPLDDDTDDDLPSDDPLFSSLLQALPNEAQVEARPLTTMSPGVSPCVCVGVDHVFAGGESLLAWPTALLDDPEATPLTLDIPGHDALTAVAEDSTRTLTVADRSGALWRRERARDPWRRLRWTDEAREVPVALSAQGTTLWVLSSHGVLRRETNGHFVAVRTAEQVGVFCIDAQGRGALSLRGRRRDGIRTTDDGTTWSPRPTPEALEVNAMARVGEVIAVAGREGAFVSTDGGVRWTPWPMLVGATALGVGETHDGDARVFAALTDGDRTIVASARVTPEGSPEGAVLVCDVSALLPPASSEEEPVCVDRIVAVDRAGRQLLVTTSTGAVLRVMRTP
jgi:hypothetical protein